MLKRDTRREADTRSPVANNIQIIGFYTGTEPDHRSRYVQEIQAWPCDQLETAHDYIQWFFPFIREKRLQRCNASSDARDDTGVQNAARFASEVTRLRHGNCTC